MIQLFNHQYNEYIQKIRFSSVIETLYEKKLLLNIPKDAFVSDEYILRGDEVFLIKIQIDTFYSIINDNYNIV